MSRRPGRPGVAEPALDEPRILDAALELVDRDGLDRLTMRRLGRELGVDPMAIYHHIPDKQALIMAVVRRVFSRMAETVADLTHDARDWRCRAREWADVYRATARAHPNLALAIVSNAEAATEGSLATTEPLYAVLRDGGVRDRDLVPAVGVIVDFINGFVLAEASRAAAWDDDRAPLRARLRGCGDQFPATARAIQALSGTDLDGEFRFGIDVIINGLAASRDAS